VNVSLQSYCLSVQRYYTVRVARVRTEASVTSRLLLTTRANVVLRSSVTSARRLPVITPTTSNSVTRIVRAAITPVARYIIF